MECFDLHAQNARMEGVVCAVSTAFIIVLVSQMRRIQRWANVLLISLLMGLFFGATYRMAEASITAAQVEALRPAMLDWEMQTVGAVTNIAPLEQTFALSADIHLGARIVLGHILVGLIAGVLVAFALTEWQRWRDRRRGPLGRLQTKA
jgi:hypothetical protein